MGHEALTRRHADAGPYRGVGGAGHGGGGAGTGRARAGIVEPSRSWSGDRAAEQVGPSRVDRVRRGCVVAARDRALVHGPRGAVRTVRPRQRARPDAHRS